MSGEKYLVVGPGGGERLRFLDDSALLLKTTGEHSDGTLAFYEYLAEPAAKGSPQHVHHGHDETFYVVDGTFEFTLETSALVAGPGTFISVSRGQPHGFRNSGDAPGRMVGTFSPPHFAQYFRELARVIETTGAAPALSDWVELYGRYETTFYDLT